LGKRGLRNWDKGMKLAVTSILDYSFFMGLSKNNFLKWELGDNGSGKVEVLRLI
jgi:hypothetical protein